TSDQNGSSGSSGSAIIVYGYTGNATLQRGENIDIGFFCGLTYIDHGNGSRNIPFSFSLITHYNHLIDRTRRILHHDVDRLHIQTDPDSLCTHSDMCES